MQENKKTNHGMQVDVIDFPLYDALCESIEQRNLTLGKAILLSGNTSVTRVLQEDGIKLLRACAKSQDHRFAESMALLLISKGVDLKQDTVSQNSDYSRRELPSLQGALSAGNKSLTHNLLECGVDWSKIAPSSVMSFFSALDGNGLCGIKISDFETVFTSAVVPCCSFVKLTMGQTWERRDEELHLSERGASGADERKRHRGRAEKIAIETYDFLKKKLLSLDSIAPELAGLLRASGSVPIDVVIYAAFYGYADFIQTVVKTPDDLNRANRRRMWPLFAAVLGGDWRTCSRLLHLKANANYALCWPLCLNPPDVGKASHQVLNVLHQAVFSKRQDIAELLINFGADVNQPCDIATVNKLNWFCASCCWWCGVRANRHGTDCLCLIDVVTLTSLSIAIKRCDWGIANLLLKRGAQVGSVELRLAIETGNHSFIKAALPFIQDIKVLDHPLNGHTPLQLALQRRESQICDVLLRAGAKPPTEAEYLPLAAGTGSTEILLQLLGSLKLEHCQQHISQALQKALRSGFSAMVKILILNGARVYKGWLSEAFGAYQRDPLIDILRNTKNLQESARERSPEGISLLETAVMNRNPGMARLALDLLPQGYDSGALVISVCRTLSASAPESYALLNELLERRKNALEEDIDPTLENTAISLAAYFGEANLLDNLPERPQPQKHAIIPGTPFWAVTDEVLPKDREDRARNIQLEIANFQYYLPRHKLTTWCRNREADPYVTSPLFMAVKSNNHEAIRMLLHKGYGVDSRTVTAAILHQQPMSTLSDLILTCNDINGIAHDGIYETGPLQIAVFLERLHVVQIVTQHGANVDHYCHNFHLVHGYVDYFKVRSALQMAIRCPCSDEMVYHLVHCSTDINSPAHPFGGRTILQSAVCMGQIAISRYLIKQGANINAPRALIEGRTCLEVAAEEGHLDMVQFLLNQGVDTDGKGKMQYIRAVVLAQRGGYAAVAELLRRHRRWDTQDEILFDRPHALRSYARSPFLHPDEISLKERQCTKTRGLRLRLE